jgi:hypothetical protein
MAGFEVSTEERDLRLFERQHSSAVLDETADRPSR